MVQAAVKEAVMLNINARQERNRLWVQAAVKEAVMLNSKSVLQ